MRGGRKRKGMEEGRRTERNEKEPKDKRITRNGDGWRKDTGERKDRIKKGGRQKMDNWKTEEGMIKESM